MCWQGLPAMNCDEHWSRLVVNLLYQHDKDHCSWVLYTYRQHVKLARSSLKPKHRPFSHRCLMFSSAYCVGRPRTRFVQGGSGHSCTTSPRLRAVIADAGRHVPAACLASRSSRCHGGVRGAGAGRWRAPPLRRPDRADTGDMRSLVSVSARSAPAAVKRRALTPPCEASIVQSPQKSTASAAGEVQFVATRPVLPRVVFCQGFRDDLEWAWIESCWNLTNQKKRLIGWTNMPTRGLAWESAFRWKTQQYTIYNIHTVFAL